VSNFAPTPLSENNQICLSTSTPFFQMRPLKHQVWFLRISNLKLLQTFKKNSAKDAK